MADAYGLGETKVEATDVKPRCAKCGKLLAEKVTRPWAIKCSRCPAVNRSPGGVR